MLTIEMTKYCENPFLYNHNVIPLGTCVNQRKECVLSTSQSHLYLGNVIIVEDGTKCHKIIACVLFGKQKAKQKYAKPYSRK